MGKQQNVFRLCARIGRQNKDLPLFCTVRYEKHPMLEYDEICSLLQVLQNPPEGTPSNSFNPQSPE